MLDQHPWKGQAGYQAQKFEQWYHRQGKLVEGTVREAGTAVKGGSRKGTDRLSLVLVDEAGHMAPADQAEGVGAIVRAWIR
jgi:cathepsin A (carboxypeptidase C)